MSHNMKNLKNTLTFFLVFIALQIMAGFVVNTAWPLVTGTTDITPARLMTASGLASLLTIAVFVLAHWCGSAADLRRYLLSRPWLVLFWSAVAALGAVVPSTWLQEQMPELPNWLENEFDMLLSERGGYFVLALLAPIAEEVVFRGAILRSLLKGSMRPWTAIALSALLFALIHGNPAQMPHAFLCGLLLGWMFWRTGSIVPGVMFHWANNTVAFVLYRLYPDPSLKLADLFGGSQQKVYMAVGFSLLILVPALYQLHVWMKKADE